MTNEINKDSFFLQGKDRAQDGAGSKAKNIVFEWNMLYQCNYRCPYCFFDGKWEEYGKRTVFCGAEKWISIWSKIFDKYGRCSLVISGGEPLIYPEFDKIIAGISRYHFPINISTNASKEFKGLAEKLDPLKVSFTLSFHPGQSRLEDIIEKKKLLAGKGFKGDYINLCLYPEHMPGLKDYIRTASESGEVLKLIPFVGQYKGVSYPDGYSSEEKKLMGLDQVWESNVKRKGKLCVAGYRSALIFPDGKVARCGQVGERVLVGNVFSDQFELFKKPTECDVELCPCLEGGVLEDTNA